MTGGKAPKIKGTGYEREIVNYAQKRGIFAHRIPLSGAVEGFKGDIILSDTYWECKRWKSAPKKLVKILEKADQDKCEGLIMRADRQPLGESFVVMSLDKLLDLIKKF